MDNPFMDNWEYKYAELHHLTSIVFTLSFAEVHYSWKLLTVAGMKFFYIQMMIEGTFFKL
jgi:hypothetical protein